MNACGECGLPMKGSSLPQTPGIIAYGCTGEKCPNTIKDVREQVLFDQRIDQEPPPAIKARLEKLLKGRA